MKKFFSTKKIVTTLIAINFALILLTIFFLIRRSFDSKRNLQELKNTESYNLEENKSLDVNNDTNEIIDIADFENNTEEVEDNKDQNEKEKNTIKQEKKDNTPKYYIKINNKSNRVNIYGKDNDNNYTVLVKTMICSTGEFTPPCNMYPKTKYKMIGTRYTWAKFHSVYVRYPTQIVGGIFFHSVPYLEERKDALSYSMFDHLGEAVSAGCIRLQVSDAKWIYNNVESGTIVEFNTNITNNASAPKISSNEKCRNWDPTDTDGNNPWHNKANLIETEENTKKNDEPSEPQSPNIVDNNINTNVTEKNVIKEAGSDMDNEVINDVNNNTIINDANTNVFIANDIINNTDTTNTETISNELNDNET